jgi:hypothetical protein
MIYTKVYLYIKDNEDMEYVCQFDYDIIIRAGRMPIPFGFVHRIVTNYLNTNKFKVLGSSSNFDKYRYKSISGIKKIVSKDNRIRFNVLVDKNNIDFLLIIL